MANFKHLIYNIYCTSFIKLGIFFGPFKQNNNFKLNFQLNERNLMCFKVHNNYFLKSKLQCEMEVSLNS